MINNISKGANDFYNKYRKTFEEQRIFQFEKNGVFETTKVNVKKLVELGHEAKCVCCGSKKNLTVDHIVSRGNGGKNGIKNLQIMCVECNGAKGSEDNLTFEEIRARVRERILKRIDKLRNKIENQDRSLYEYFEDLHESLSIFKYGVKNLDNLVNDFNIKKETISATISSRDKNNIDLLELESNLDRYG